MGKKVKKKIFVIQLWKKRHFGPNQFLPKKVWFAKYVLYKIVCCLTIFCNKTFWFANFVEEVLVKHFFANICSTNEYIHHNQFAEYNSFTLKNYNFHITLEKTRSRLSDWLQCRHLCQVYVTNLKHLSSSSIFF